ncbi:MAG: hypothetical protein U7126_30895 [Microcoleus sp.]
MNHSDATGLDMTSVTSVTSVTESVAELPPSSFGYNSKPKTPESQYDRSSINK